MPPKRRKAPQKRKATQPEKSTSEAEERQPKRRQAPRVGARVKAAEPERSETGADDPSGEQEEQELILPRTKPQGKGKEKVQDVHNDQVSDVKNTSTSSVERVPSIYRSSYIEPTDSTKMKLWLRDGEKCWACENEIPIDIAHVIPSSKHWFQCYQERGLVPFSHPAHVDNLIPLCKNCHDQFDAATPGWIFLPKDLEFLIEYERANYQLRMDLANAGEVIPRRMVPPAQQMLYKRYIIFPKFKPQISDEKTWCGSPTAAILKAAHGISNPVGLLSPKSRRDFLTLVELYGRPDPQPAAQHRTTRQRREVSVNKATLTGNRHEPPLGLSQTGGAPPGGGASSGSFVQQEAMDTRQYLRRGDSSYVRSLATKNTRGKGYFDFAWGPCSSSEDKIAWTLGFKPVSS